MVLVGFIPVLSCPHLYAQGHLKGGNPFHEADEVGTQPGNFILGDFQDQFVVNLQDQTALAPGLIQPALYRQHGAFDQIGSRALKRGIDGGPLRSLTPAGP